MPYTDEAALVFDQGFIYHFLDTLFLLLDGVFGDLGLDCGWGLSCKGGDPGTVVTPVLQEFDPLGNHNLGLIRR